MAIPALAKKFDVFMDPGELLEYQADLAGNILEAGEQISGAPTLTMGAEGTVLGLGIKTGGGYDAAVVGGTSVKFWLEVTLAERENAAWFDGVDVGIKITVNTNSVPARRRERTVVVRVQQQ